MVYEVPSSKTNADKNRFEFKIGDETFNVPMAQYLDGDMVELIADASERGGIAEDAARYRLFGPKGTPARDAVQRLNAIEVTDLVSAWFEASHISAGESAASTDS